MSPRESAYARVLSGAREDGRPDPPVPVRLALGHGCDGPVRGTAGLGGSGVDAAGLGAAGLGAADLDGADLDGAAPYGSPVTGAGPA